MVLSNSLYFVESSSVSEGEYAYVIRLNPDHIIYKAHFPGEPITPGVCILQIGHELLSMSLKEKLDVVCARNVKFLSVLRPDSQFANVRIQKVKREDEQIKAQIEISTQVNPIAKMSIVCKIAK